MELAVPEGDQNSVGLGAGEADSAPITADGDESPMNLNYSLGCFDPELPRISLPDYTHGNTKLCMLISPKPEADLSRGVHVKENRPLTFRDPPPPPIDSRIEPERHTLQWFAMSLARITSSV